MVFFESLGLVVYSIGLNKLAIKAIDGRSLATTTVTVCTASRATRPTISSGNSGESDGTGSSAKFYMPSGITTDGTNLYVVDRGNCTIRQVVIASRVVTTLAGKAGVYGGADGTGTAATFSAPVGITTDGSSLFVTDTDNHTVRKISVSSGTVTTIAGNLGIPGASDGTGAAAHFFYPKGITTDGVNLYLADQANDTVRKMVINSGAVTTLAGTPGFFGSVDGPGTTAKFDGPAGIIISGGALYLTDAGSDKIRKITTATGTVTTLAGTEISGITDGTGASTRFGHPEAITTDGSNLYIADSGNCTIRKMVLSTGEVSTIAGAPGVCGYSDGTGSAALFKWIAGITTDGTNLYVADTRNNAIRKVVIDTGVVTTLAGSPGNTVTADGVGVMAKFNNPAGITRVNGNLYVIDVNNAIRKIEIATGDVKTLYGSVGTGVDNASFYYISMGITSDGTNLYIAGMANNSIAKVQITTGEETTIAGSVGQSGSTDGTGTIARFNYPVGVTTDGTNLYVTDTGNTTIRKIVIATGVVTTIAGNINSPKAPNNTGAPVDGVGSAAIFSWPAGITTDGKSLFVVDRDINRIRKID
jgi:sugar lactone lactonase YvrE